MASLSACTSSCSAGYVSSIRIPCLSCLQPWQITLSIVPKFNFENMLKSIERYQVNHLACVHHLWLLNEPFLTSSRIASSRPWLFFFASIHFIISIPSFKMNPYHVVSSKVSLFPKWLQLWCKFLYSNSYRKAFWSSNLTCICKGNFDMMLSFTQGEGKGLL